MLYNCPKCGQKTALLNYTCEHCGCKTITCPECGNTMELGTTICSYCGFPIAKEKETTIKKESIKTLNETFDKHFDATRRVPLLRFSYFLFFSIAILGIIALYLLFYYGLKENYSLYQAYKVIRTIKICSVLALLFATIYILTINSIDLSTATKMVTSLDFAKFDHVALLKTIEFSKDGEMLINGFTHCYIRELRYRENPSLKKIEKLKVATRVLLFIALSFSLCIGLFPNLNGLLLNNAIGSSFSFDFNVSLIIGIIFLITFIVVSIVFNKTDNFMKLNKEYVKKIQSK